MSAPVCEHKCLFCTWQYCVHMCTKHAHSFLYVYRLLARKNLFCSFISEGFQSPLQRPVVADVPVCNGIIWLDGIEPVIWEDSNQDGGSNTDIVKRVSHLGFHSRIPQKHRQHTQETQKKSRRIFTVFHR